ncbi:MAG: ankyrin repeat domain-containing protein [Alphaproteobacteria bacterium]|nr:ankyrin repeat domain-containing protein [Alphaproteobacteria bacterium]
MNSALSKNLVNGKWKFFCAALVLVMCAGNVLAEGKSSSNIKSAINSENQTGEQEYVEHPWFEPLYEMTSEWVMRQKIKEFWEEKHIIPAKPSNIIEEDNIEKVKELLAQDNIDINERNKNGDTALMTAIEVRLGADNIVKLLLEKEAYVDVKNKEGKTPLMLAAARAEENIVDLLLKKEQTLK